MILAPIVIFCYNRPLLLKQTVEALQKNILSSDSDLIVFCDGPKNGASVEVLNQINHVREFCDSISGFKSITVFKSESNKGLQDSVISGLNQVLEKYESVIVVEDDVVTSPYFLDFMNKGLKNYENESRVLSIGSWNYYYPSVKNFFNHMPDTIAWATWRNRWRLFEQDGKKLYDLLENRNLIDKFNLQGNFDFQNMLRQQYEGKVSSWAIRWTALAVLNNTLTLYPKISLSKHIGFGMDSTNCEDEDFNENIQLANESIAQFDIDVKEDEASLLKFIEFEKMIKKSPAANAVQSLNFKNRVKSKIIKLIPYRFKQFVKSKILKTDDTQPYGWFGNYKSWELAQKECEGYDSVTILDKVKDSVLKVKNGIAKYERDSVLFNEIQYSPELIEAFKNSIENNRLHVVDFGGSLGSSYFQHKEIFKNLENLKWNVVEQKHFVECGLKDIKEDKLDFSYTISEALTKQDNQVLLLSSVIPYFKEPYQLISELLLYNFKFIIVDRTAFIEGDTERITKQIVPNFIYKASYPAWFLNERKFVNAFLKDYELIKEFKSPFDSDSELEDGAKVYRKGFYFKLKQ
jgi:putative methyltransferase (TIGR04325 family)